MTHINEIDFGKSILNIAEFEKGTEPKEDLYVDSTTQSGIFETSNGDKYTYQFDTDLFIRRVS